MTKKIVVSLSGGLDSTTVLAAALYQRHSVLPVFFNYGSKHNPYETKAVRKIMNFYFNKYPDFLNDSVPEVDMTEIGRHLESNLMSNGGVIPEGHYESETMKQTVVPGRNMMFASVLAAIGESRGCNEVWMGMHAGDHHIYPDCRPEFVEYTKLAIEASSDHKLTLLAPYLNSKKADILRLGLELMIPYDLTRTCYKQQEVACGKCGSCQERLEAFKLNGVEDPINYESRELLPKRK